MRCTHFRKHIIPYAEGTLPEDLRESMTLHASSCEECARELAELCQTVELLQGAEFEAMEPAADLRSRVMARVSGSPVRRTWWTGRLQAYSAAAAALLLFAVVLTAVQPLFRGGDEAAEVAPRLTSPSLEEPGADVPADRIQKSGPRTTGDGPVDAVESGPPARTFPPDERLLEQPEDRMSSVNRSGVDPHYGAMRESPVSGASPKDGRRVSVSGGAKSGTVTDEVSRYEFESKGASGGEEATGAVGVGAASVAAEAPGTKTGEDLAGPAGPAAPVTAESADKPVNGSEPVGVFRKDSDQRLREERVLYLETKLKDFPTNRRVMEELLVDYRESGRAEDEYAIAKRLTELEPENGSYWFARGQAAERAQMPQTAAAAYRQAIKLEIGEPELGVAKSRLEALKPSR